MCLSLPPSVGVLGEVFSSDSDCEIVKPQLLSFSRSVKPGQSRRYERDDFA